MASTTNLQTFLIFITSYRLLFDNLYTLFKLIRSPFLFYTIFSTILSFIISPEISNYIFIMFQLIIYVYMIPIFVSWSRLILFDEELSPYLKLYIWKNAERSYFLEIILVSLLFIVIFFVIGIFIVIFILIFWFIFEDVSNTYFYVFVMGLVYVLFSVLFVSFVRVFLIFPSAAIGKKMSFSKSKELTHGNTIRLSLVFLAGAAVFSVIEFFHGFLGLTVSYGANINIFLNFISIAITYLKVILSSIISVGIMALCYRELVMPPQQPEP